MRTVARWSPSSSWQALLAAHTAGTASSTRTACISPVSDLVITCTHVFETASLQAVSSLSCSRTLWLVQQKNNTCVANRGIAHLGVMLKDVVTDLGQVLVQLLAVDIGSAYQHGVRHILHQELAHPLQVLSLHAIDCSAHSCCTWRQCSPAQHLPSAFSRA